MRRGALPACGNTKPQDMMTSSSDPSTVGRITGADRAGKIALSGSNAAARLWGTLNSRTIASRDFVSEYKLHMVSLQILTYARRLSL
jgi:hypothetical protein